MLKAADRGRYVTEEWLALRCNTGKTGPLAAKLAEAQTHAWTPLQMTRRRKPRSSVRQDVPVPLLPTFVFLPLQQLEVAVMLRERCRVPAFSPMRFMGKLALFRETQLQPLRLIAHRGEIAAGVCRFPKAGVRVRLAFGGFEGLTGVVTGRTKHESLVELDAGGMPLKIPPFLFTTIEG